LLWVKKITKKRVMGISEIKATRYGVGEAWFITKGRWSRREGTEYGVYRTLFKKGGGGAGLKTKSKS